MSFISFTGNILSAAACVIILTAFSLQDQGMGFYLKQKDRTIPLLDIQSTIELEKKEFELIMHQPAYNADNNEFHSTQLVFTLEKNDLYKMREGISTSDIDYFSPGTGYASAGIYRSSIINTAESTGHHYIIYEKSGVHRANLLKETNGMLQLSHKVNSFIKDSKTISIKKVNFPELYMILFSDRNLNKVVDNGEYRLITIKFK